MKIKTLLIVLLAVFFLLPSCKNKKRRVPRNDKMAISMSQNAKGDSAIYGLACVGTNDSAVVLLPNQGGDPIKYRIVWAMNNHQVFGTPSIGDWICVIPQADSKNSARMVIDLDQVKGTWTHAVKPVFKDISGISRKQIREMFENMPDSIKETYLVPREYGFTLSRQSKAQAIGRIYGSNDEESPVKYPEVPHYTEWHAYNGKLILVQGRVEYNNIALLCGEREVINIGVVFQKGRFHFAEIALVLLGNLHFATQEAAFVDDGGEVFLQGEVAVFVQQGKVHVFRVAVHAVEDTQTGAAIESCFGKEATPIESAEHYLLHHFV